MHQRTNLVKFFLFSLLSILTGTSAFAQSKGFIVIGDSLYKEGYINFKESKPDEVFFQEFKKAQPVYYTAGQLTGLGYDKGATYKALTLNHQGKQQTVFLKILAQGKFRLFMLRGKGGPYFYVQNDTLVQLTKTNLQQVLKPFVADCPSTLWHLKRLPLNQASLAAFGNTLNKGKCSTVPASSFGVAVSANSSTIKVSENAFVSNKAGNITMTSENISAGLFAETPAWVLKNLAVSGQLTYHKLRFGHSYADAATDQDTQLKMNMVQLRLAPKYYIPFNRFRIFVETGFEMYYLLQQSGKVIQGLHTPNGNSGANVQLIYFNDPLSMPAMQYGFTAGTGVQYYYLPKKYVSLSLTTSHGFNDRHTLNNLSTTLRINL